MSVNKKIIFNNKKLASPRLTTTGTTMTVVVVESSLPAHLLHRCPLVVEPSPCSSMGQGGGGTQEGREDSVGASMPPQPHASTTSLHASTATCLHARRCHASWREDVRRGVDAACRSLIGAGAAASCRENEDETRERSKKSPQERESVDESCCILALNDVRVMGGRICCDMIG
jgi:hypothetical protein